MKLGLTLLCVAVSSYAVEAASAERAWLLIYRSNHYSLVSAASGNVQSLVDFGTVRSYGVSATSISIISENATGDGTVLSLIDRASGKVVSTQAVQGFVPIYMAGPVKNMLVTDRAVYFDTLRQAAVQTASLKDKNGVLDLNRLNVRDGTMESFPIPLSCKTPRLSMLNGMPVMYAWNGYGVCRFDPAKGAVEEVVQRKDVYDILAKERFPSETKASGLEPFSTSIVIDGVGVFRLSKNGALDKVVESDLSPTVRPRKSAKLGFDLGPDRQYATLLAGTSAGKVAIGVLGKRNGEQTFEYLDAQTLTPSWETKLAASVRLSSVVPVDGGSIAYLDEAKRTSESVSPAGTTIVASLETLGAAGDPLNAYILAVESVN
jgi:hypothetical protein